MCASAIYYQMDSVTKTIHCKANYAINLNSNPSIQAAGDSILFFNLH